MVTNSSNICSALIPHAQSYKDENISKRKYLKTEADLHSLTEILNIDSNSLPLITFKFNESEQIISYNKKIDFTKEDEKQLITWFNGNDKEPYVSNLHRIELINFILIGQVFKIKFNQQIIIGHLLLNNLMTRLDLAECYQKFLFKKML